MGTISFDRAASFYDETRGHPPQVSASIQASLERVLSLSQHILEIGIGTGRIARPLLAQGYHLTGLDVSRAMMGRLVAQMPPGHPMPALVQGDLTAQPLASGIFDAVLSVHVFHLIADWQTALEEVRRVLRKDGMLLIGSDWRPPDSAMSLIREKWHELTRRHDPAPDRLGNFGRVEEALRVQGASREQWTAAEWTTPYSTRAYLESLEKHMYSASWRIPEQEMPGYLAELRAWAEERFGPLDQVHQTPRKFIWQAFQWPGKDPT